MRRYSPEYCSCLSSHRWGSLLLLPMPPLPKASTRPPSSPQELRLYYPIMHNSKNQAYQQKILHLLLREKAVTALNQTLARQNTTLNNRLTAIVREHQLSMQKLRERTEDDIARAEMQTRLAKMDRITEEQKKTELEEKLNQITQSLNDALWKKQRLDEDNRQLSRSITQLSEEITTKESALTAMQQKCQKQEEAIRKLNEKNIINQSQIEELSKDKPNLIKAISKLQAELAQTKQLYEDALQKMELFKNEAAAKAKIKLQQEDENSRYEAKLQQLTKQNSMLRDRRKKLQEDGKVLEQQKELAEDACKRAQKINRKNKQVIAEHEARIKELQDQSAINAEKWRSLDRNLKAAKREIQQLQESLQNAEEALITESNKYKKYEASSKTQKAELLEKQQRYQELSQASVQQKKELQACQRNTFQLSLQLQKLAKQNKYLSQQYQQQQEKRILAEGERQKAISGIVRDKDTLSRANFKLLQLLELKDQAIRAILEAIQTKSERIQLSTNLDGEEFLKQIRQADKQKLRNGKERIALLDEWIKSKR